VATLPTLLSQFNLKLQNIKVFIDNINIDTQTTYSENGKININRCPYEENPHLVLNGDRVSQKGRMVTEDDGTSCFRPYATNSGSRYNNLFQTAHGTVKETLNDVIIQLRFPKRLGKALIEAMFKDETEEVAAFIKTRPSETNWSI
jgi:hypothetical protein